MSWVASFARQNERQVAWLSLDEGDCDQARFIAYLVAALQTIQAGIGEGVLAAIQSSQPPPTDDFSLPCLTKFLFLAPAPLKTGRSSPSISSWFWMITTCLIKQAVDASKSVDGALTFLLDHLPPQMHLVIITREDPHLPLARYRARGRLTELRALPTCVLRSPKPANSSIA